ncbi:peptidylprolyl isomerase [Sphingorhabdus lutea]|uniref:Peptidyl-prolyl cis-trans isomerase n=2 Tax=Sphingorhabdus lutea TaxID=1913578 RepID=A0A1L3JFE4_9SPHN|nr:peptidylprolyl isomerase [Sphingorhabdus lutea]
MAILSACAFMPPLANAQDAAPAAPAASMPVPPSQALDENIWVLDLSTGGRVMIQLYPEVAPGHVERIKTLTAQGFYDGLVFHRVIDGFMAQGGDPTGTGLNGSDLPDLQAEFSTLPHVRGTVSMARAQDKNSANSQFFIVFQPRFSLDNNYSIFGRVMSGMQYVDAIQRGEPPVNPSRIVQASMKTDNKAAPAMAAPVSPSPVQPDEKQISLDDLNAQ